MENWIGYAAGVILLCGVAVAVFHSTCVKQVEDVDDSDHTVQEEPEEKGPYTVEESYIVLINNQDYGYRGSSNPTIILPIATARKLHGLEILKELPDGSFIGYLNLGFADSDDPKSEEWKYHHRALSSRNRDYGWFQLFLYNSNLCVIVSPTEGSNKKEGYAEITTLSIPLHDCDFSHLMYDQVTATVYKEVRKAYRASFDSHVALHARYRNAELLFLSQKRTSESSHRPYITRRAINTLGYMFKLRNDGRDSNWIGYVVYDHDDPIHRHVFRALIERSEGGFVDSEDPNRLVMVITPAFVLNISFEDMYPAHRPGEVYITPVESHNREMDTEVSVSIHPILTTQPAIELYADSAVTGGDAATKVLNHFQEILDMQCISHIDAWKKNLEAEQYILKTPERVSAKRQVIRRSAANLKRHNKPVNKSTPHPRKLL